jgi:hypothetical protein
MSERLWAQVEDVDGADRVEYLDLGQDAAAHGVHLALDAALQQLHEVSHGRRPTHHGQRVQVQAQLHHGHLACESKLIQLMM